MLEMRCTRGTGIRVFIKSKMIMRLMRVMVYLSNTDLCSPPSPTIVKGTKLICELRLKPIKPVLDLMKLLYTKSLSKKHYFHIIQTVRTMPSCMPNQATSRA